MTPVHRRTPKEIGTIIETSIEKRDARGEAPQNGAILNNPAEVDPEFEARLAMHRALAEEGSRRVTRRTTIAFALMWGPALLALWLLPQIWGAALGGGLFWGGWAVGLWLNSRWFDRWWCETIADPDVDVDLLHEMAIDRGLMHRRTGIFGQGKSLARLTASVRGLPSPSGRDAL